MASKFKISDYGPNPHAGANNNSARTKGWGPGWPNCQSSKMAKAKAPGGAVAQVRKEIVALVETLFAITELEGYRLKPAATGGFNCRPIAGTRIASNHSWGLAIDLNWNDNPYSLIFKSDIPPAVVNAWESSCFYWGGRYRIRKDAMHFEFLGGPGDVARCLSSARKRLASIQGPVPVPAPVPTPVPVPPKPSTGRKLGSRTLKVGNTGADVKVLQRFLPGLVDDGVFGPLTEAAVKAYQRKRKMKITGIADKETTLPPIVKALSL